MEAWGPRESLEKQGAPGVQAAVGWAQVPPPTPRDSPPSTGPWLHGGDGQAPPCAEWDGGSSGQPGRGLRRRLKTPESGPGAPHTMAWCGSP